MQIDSPTAPLPYAEGSSAVGLPEYSATNAIESANPTPAEPATAPPSGAEQLSQINTLKRKALVAGDTWYIVARPWYRRWAAACAEGDSMEKDLEGLSPADVGPIDNSPLLDSSGNLVVVPAEGDNAEYLPSEAWMLLLQW